MPPLGTAPRRVSAGEWRTRSGRKLTKDGAAYWERQYRTGHTDGNGHFGRPLPAKASGPQFKQLSPPPKKPSFETVLKMRHGDKAAKREFDTYEAHRRMVEQAKAEAEAQVDTNLFGKAAPDVRNARKVVNPVVGAVIQGVGDTLVNPAPHVTAALRGHVSPVGIGADAAMLFPFGRAGRAAKAGFKAAEAARAAESGSRLGQIGREAQAALSPGQRVLGEVESAAPRLRAQQEALRAPERARRAAAIGAAYEAAGGGEAGARAARAALRGSHPAVEFTALRDISHEDMNDLLDAIHAHPALHAHEKDNLRMAVLAARDEDKLPTPYEEGLMKRAFGEDSAKEFAKQTLGQKTLNAAGEVLNIPRALQTFLDVSGVLRQGLVATIHHPILAAKNIGPMFHMMFDEKYFQDIQRAIKTRPNAYRYERGKLSLTDLADKTHREEGFMSNLAEKIPVIGRAVRGSARSYTGFLNSLRADIFDTMWEGAIAAGRPATPKLEKHIARQVNIWTGRGGLGKYGERVAVPLNTAFYSPRLFASRMQTFASIAYKDTDPYVRKQAALAAAKLVASGMTILFMAKIAGAKVGIDPTSSDFGKIVVGNTHIDIWGGHQQIAKTIYQAATGEATSTVTGVRESKSRPYIVGKFVRGKLSPPGGLAYSAFKGSDYNRQPLTLRKDVLGINAPLLAGDVVRAIQDSHNPLAGIAVYGIGMWGIGTQTYSKQPAKKHTSRSKKPSGYVPSWERKSTGGYVPSWER